MFCLSCKKRASQTLPTWAIAWHPRISGWSSSPRTPSGSPGHPIGSCRPPPLGPPSRILHTLGWQMSLGDDITQNNIKRKTKSKHHFKERGKTRIFFFLKIKRNVFFKVKRVFLNIPQDSSADVIIWYFFRNILLQYFVFWFQSSIKQKLNAKMARQNREMSQPPVKKM